MYRFGRKKMIIILTIVFYILQIEDEFSNGECFHF